MLDVFIGKLGDGFDACARGDGPPLPGLPLRSESRRACPNLSLEQKEIKYACAKLWNGRREPKSTRHPDICVRAGRHLAVYLQRHTTRAGRT